jgi:hypothetical protein
MRIRNATSCSAAAALVLVVLLTVLLQAELACGVGLERKIGKGTKRLEGWLISQPRTLPPAPHTNDNGKSRVARQAVMTALVEEHAHTGELLGVEVETVRRLLRERKTARKRAHPDDDAHRPHNRTAERPAEDVHARLEMACAQLRVLYPSADGAWCAGESHTRTSLGCMLTEARVLGRVLLYDEKWCVNAVHGGGGSGGGRHQSTTDHVELSPWALSATEYMDACLPHHLEGGRYAVAHSRTPLLELANSAPYRDALLLVHDFHRRSSRRFPYWYTYCKHYPALTVQELLAPAHFRRAGQLLQERLRTLGGGERSGTGSYVAVHVRRGDKVVSSSRWPHLAEDTDVENIAAALELAGYRCGGDTVVFIASNEHKEDFFNRAPLSTCYRLYRTLDFLDDLRQQLSIPPADRVPDNAIYYVDMEVYAHADRRLETFYDLTCTPKAGTHHAKMHKDCLTPLQRLKQMQEKHATYIKKIRHIA